MPKILIVEHDVLTAKKLQTGLGLLGFKTQMAGTLTQAWDALKEEHFDLICLEVNFSDGSGLEFCKKIRFLGNEVQILFISSVTDESVAIKAMTAGADDFIRRPIGEEELKLRITKMLKKVTTGPVVLQFGKLTIDSLKKTMAVKDKMVSLGKKELDILTLLVRRAGGTVTRESILNTIYAGADLYDRTVDSHISHLRKKLKEVTQDSLQIQSVYGLGYKLEWS